MATISNLYIDQGTTFGVTITLTGYNLTGYTVRSQFRKSHTSSIGHNFTTTIIDAAAGKVKLSLTPSQSSEIKPGRYVYDIEIESPSGDKYRTLEGSVIIAPEVTKT